MSEVSIQVQETVENVEIVAQNNVIEVNITRQSGGGGGAVESVNGQTGDVVLDADDISDASTANKFVTASEKTAIAHENRSTLDLITEAFTTALKNAYDGAVAWISTNGANVLNHLTNTSNPHNTTASQVGAYTTSQVDTLLSGKENTITAGTTGQYYRGDKTFQTLNVSAVTGLQTALDLKADRFLNVKIPTTAYATGTTSEFEVYRLEITGNTFNATDMLFLRGLIFQKLGTAAAYTIRFKLSTSSTMPSGTTDQIGTMIPTNTNISAFFSRGFAITGGNLIGFQATLNSSTETNTGATLHNVPFDRTVTQYLYVSVTLGNANDQVRLVGGQISNV